MLTFVECEIEAETEAATTEIPDQELTDNEEINKAIEEIVRARYPSFMDKAGCIIEKLHESGFVDSFLANNGIEYDPEKLSTEVNNFVDKTSFKCSFIVFSTSSSGITLYLLIVITIWAAIKDFSIQLKAFFSCWTPKTRNEPVDNGKTQNEEEKKLNVTQKPRKKT